MPADQITTSRNRLRFWAVLDLVYGLSLAYVVLRFVPWKWPLANTLALLYFAAHVVAAPGLWHQRLWAWRLGVVTALVGIGSGIAVISGLLLSWSYLRGIYGSFGLGASLVSLLLAATAFQVLSLYPALRLRAFIAARGDWKLAVRGVLGAFVLLPILLSVGVQMFFRIPNTAKMEQTKAQTLLSSARLCLQSKACVYQADSAASQNETVFLSVFQAGQRQARTKGTGRDLAAAVMHAAVQLAKDPKAHQGRLKLDRVLASAPVLSWPMPLQAVGFDPGKDGLRVSQKQEGVAILPDDMIAADVFGAAPLLPFLPEVRLGVSPQWIAATLTTQPGAKLERFNVDSWIECPAPERACHADRGVVQIKALTSQEAAVRAGQFIVRSQHPDGTFSYVYRPWTNTSPPSGYSVARHAGTAYALAMLEALAPGNGFGESSTLAIAWLLGQAAPVCGGQLCVREGVLAKVGTNALTLLSIATLIKSTGNTQWLPQAQQLANFLRSLQLPSGDLIPAYNIVAATPASAMPKQMFATEEAAMAFASAATPLNDPRLLVTADKTLHFLTVEKYSDFLGHFMYGVDSWTCMAIAALPSNKVKDSWIDFCLGYADFIGRMQFSQSDRGQAFAGHYGFSHVLVPQAPAAAGFAETLAATLAVAKEHKRDTAALEHQVRQALQALARDQVRPGNDYLAASPTQAWGAIRRSVVESEVRIDFVQHAACALARGSSLGI